MKNTNSNFLKLLNGLQCMQYSAKDFIAIYQMQPHPEGGYFRETYRAKEVIPGTALPNRFPGDRNFSTAIYFLLDRGQFSAFHRIKSDECWHFYTGGRLNIYVIDNNAKLQIIHLGNDISKGEKFQCVVPAGLWFASETAEKTSFSFVGCTVAPGFDYADFEIAKGEELIKKYPQHQSLILRLAVK